ncbi:MAG: hypothetical protein LBN12_04860 [Clostridiales Family XIII bacterium]|jgi:hypothetical protein|nr:hypothetical protein [Clostridiales Family XIII bacterium]
MFGKKKEQQNLGGTAGYGSQPAGYDAVVSGAFAMTRTEGVIDPGQKAQWNAYFRSVVGELDTQGTISAPEVQLLIPRQFSGDEIRIVQAYFEEYSFTGLGEEFDTKYAAQNVAMQVANRNAAGATGAIIGNIIAKKNADALSEVKWRLISNGDLVATDYGVYLFRKNDSITKGKNSWLQPVSGPPVCLAYNALTSALLTAWDRIEIDAPKVGGETGKFGIVTPLASLIFTLWCMAVYPDHPQVQDIIECWA